MTWVRRLLGLHADGRRRAFAVWRATEALRAFTSRYGRASG